MILVSFWRYPDPDPYRLKRIRIQIRPNDTDPYGSGSTTLLTRAMDLFRFEIEHWTKDHMNLSSVLDPLKFQWIRNRLWKSGMWIRIIWLPGSGSGSGIRNRIHRYKIRVKNCSWPLSTYFFHKELRYFSNLNLKKIGTVCCWQLI